MANILVVDDELGIRDLLSEILNDEGHNVELAENAAQARQIHRSRRGPWFFPQYLAAGLRALRHHQDQGHGLGPGRREKDRGRTPRQSPS